MQFINIHTHHYTNQSKVFEIVNQYPNAFNESIPNFSIGLHPLFIEDYRIESDFTVLLEKVQLEGCLAIGECGLDKRSEVDFELQKKVFERQLTIAQAFHKPIILHCVNSFQELIAIKKTMKITVPMIIHGFSKNIVLAQQLMQHGFYLSFGKQLLQNPKLISVLSSCPSDRFLLETDASDISIKEIYTVAAVARNQKVEELQRLVSNNFNTLFKN